jgi:hypothetical protein
VSVMDLSTLRRIIQQESPIRLEVGTVTSADPRGSRTVTVRLSGGHICSRVKTCVDGLRVGDQVLAARMMQLNQVVVIGQILGDVNPLLVRQGVLAPPTNLTVAPVPAAIVVRWDTYPGEDICWEVRYNTSASDTGATDVLVTRGSYYLHYIVDASGDMATAATYFFKVRSLRWLGDNNVMYSGWSAWANATSGGHNLREIVELELQNATELTISSGAVTRTQAYHTIDTEGDAGTDDLETISGGTEGDLLVIRPASDTRTVVVKHNAGNIWLIGKADVTLDDLKDHIAFVYTTSGFWCDIGGGAGGGGGSSTFLGLTDTPGSYSGEGSKWVRVKANETGLEFDTGDTSDFVGDLSDLKDVSDATPGDGDALVWNQASFQWEPGEGWSPGAVSLLRNGKITEYDDPDDAFTNATQSGDVVLIPPGAWVLSGAHVLASGVSIRGLGPASDCVLQATGNLGTLLTVAGGEASNFTIDFAPAHNGTPNQIALRLNSSSVGRDVHAMCDNQYNTALAVGIYVDDSRTENCRGRAWSNSDGYGIVVDGSGSTRCYVCDGYGSGGASADGIGFFSVSSPAGAELMWCRGEGIGTGAASFGVRAASGELSAWHCEFFGQSKDIDATIGTLNIHDCQYDTESGANIVQMAGDRAGKALDETIAGAWTFSDHVSLAAGKDVLPDGETASAAGLMARFINQAGMANYDHHRGSGLVIPGGCTQATTPSTLWAGFYTTYYGWYSGTYYMHAPDSASLPCGLICHSADPIDTGKRIYARVAAMGGVCFGVWADNFDANRSYAVGNYVYRFDVYLYGNGAYQELYTQVATAQCTAAGVGPAATFAPWVNHANTGPYGPLGPCGDFYTIMLIANYSGTTSRCYGYVAGENGQVSGFGNYLLCDDAWPGTNAYGARRMGTFQRLQGFGHAAWDWYWITA